MLPFGENSVGIYNWAGPGTARMIKLKYPGHKLNGKSIFNAYEVDNLKSAQEALGVTDAWVSFSWGFHPGVEKDDYNFLRQKLKNFHDFGIRTHAYVQGPNLVFDQHQDRDFFCRSHNDRLLPYHRGRKLTCVNNPYFKAYIGFKVDLALKEEVDGVFVDNLMMGLPPITISGKKLTFFGCNCLYCQKKFEAKTGFKIPKYFEVGSDALRAYIDFRSQSMLELIGELSSQVRRAGKIFGGNTFDPKHDSKLYYGTQLSALEPLVDYFLFENHDLPTHKKNNSHLKTILDSLKKPVFLVSYKDGIGREKRFSQRDFDAIYAESKQLGYFPCYKASEFTEKKTWFNFDFGSLRSVLEQDFKAEAVTIKPKAKKAQQLRVSPLTPLYNELYVPFLTAYFEKKLVREFGNYLYYQAVG